MVKGNTILTFEVKEVFPYEIFILHKNTTKLTF